METFCDFNYWQSDSTLYSMPCFLQLPWKGKLYLSYCSSITTENKNVIYFPPFVLRILKYGIHWVYMDFKLRFSSENEYSFLLVCRSMILHDYMCPKPMRSQILGKLPCKILGTEPMSSESIKHTSLLSHLYSPLKLLFTWL